MSVNYFIVTINETYYLKKKYYFLLAKIMVEIIRTVMVSPIGLEKERILAGFKKFGTTIVYLVQSEEKSGEEKRLAKTVRSFAAELMKLLEKTKEKVNLVDVNITDLKECIKVLKNIVKTEIKESSREMYINISTSSKIFTIAAIYLAGFYPHFIKLFYVRTTNYLIQDFIEILDDEGSFKDPQKCINNLRKLKKDYEENGWTKGKFEVKLVPALHFKKFTQFQLDIFRELIESNNSIKLKKLIALLKGAELKERSFRSKLAYALKDLIEYDLILKEKERNEITLNLTERGEIFSKLLF